MGTRELHWDIIRRGTMITLFLISTRCMFFPAKPDMLPAAPPTPIVQSSSLTDNSVAPSILTQKHQVQSLVIIFVMGILLTIFEVRVKQVSAYRAYPISITSPTLVDHIIYTETTSSRFRFQDPFRERTIVFSLRILD